MTDQIFNTSQKNALAALGLPVWQQRQSPVADKAVASSAYCYRLGQWLLQLSERLPVKHPQWLVDLSLTLGQPSSALAEIPQSNQQQWDPAFTLNLGVVTNVDAATKARIWQQIQNHLS
jgi:hypothetical protein